MVFDPSIVKPRLTDEILFKAYQWRLSQTDCKNRGFVIDGFPKTNEQAKRTFMSKEYNRF
jgi:adenylate kinase family enzyme